MKWINIKDKQPAFNEKVLAYVNGTSDTGYYSSHWDDMGIEWWMPLPPPPGTKIAKSDKPDFAFEKKLGIPELPYKTRYIILQAIERLFVCMQETNKLHNVSCEFFRLDFRQMYLDEQLAGLFPIGSLILDFKWGSKMENKDLKSEWGGTARCMTSDGRNVNMAEELNRIENEK
jgi:hypothetical protein